MTLSTYLNSCTTAELLEIFEDLSEAMEGKTLGYPAEGSARQILRTCGMPDAVYSLHLVYSQSAIILVSRSLRDLNHNQRPCG